MCCSSYKCRKIACTAEDVLSSNYRPKVHVDCTDKGLRIVATRRENRQNKIIVRNVLLSTEKKQRDCCVVG